MSSKKISYLNRTFEEYQDALREMMAKYYPSLSNDIDDASIGSWLIDMASAIGDNLSYHIDRCYSETNIDTAQQASSVYAIARNNGVKVPGPKGSMAEVEFSCVLPLVTEYNNPDSELGMPNWRYAPIIKRGTKVASSNQYFEILEDIDFNEQFDNNGVSNRSYQENKNSNGVTESYTIKKKGVVIAGESKIYRQVIASTDIKPFMEFVIPDVNVMNVESIIFKDGNDFQSDPTMGEFMNDNEFVPAETSIGKVDTYRFFEVDSLSDQYRWGDDITTTRAGNQNVGQSVTYKYGYYNELENTVVPTASITKGMWTPLTQKFITEHTDNGYLKVIFGSGQQIGQTLDMSCALDFTQYQISKMVRNDFLGRLPQAGWTMYILYRVGGGAASNVSKDSIRTITYLNCEMREKFVNLNEVQVASAIRNTITVTNTTPSVSGKDAPSIEEVKQLIKYNNASNNRCVTIKDYENRLLQMPPRYGCPFRIGAVEENNKVMVYVLGVDYLGHLTAVLPDQLVKNMQSYLSMYRSINDFVEFKSGRIINVSFKIDTYIDRNYNAESVIQDIINKVKDYMDINKHQLGDDIYINDLHKELSNIDGVLNLLPLHIYNEFGSEYSNTVTSQETIELSDEFSDMGSSDRLEFNLEEADYILNSDYDTMFEIKFPEKDIRVTIKNR